MSGPPQIKDDVKILQESEIRIKTRRLSDSLVIDFLLLTVKPCEFLSCFHYLQNPKRYYSKSLGYVHIGQMGDDHDDDDEEEEEEEDEKLSVALMKCDMGSGVGGSAMVVKNAVTTLRPKGVFCVGFCGGLNADKAKLGDVVVSSKLVSYASVKVTEDDRQHRGTIVPLSKHLNDIMKYACHGWKPPLKDSKQAGKVVPGVMLSGPEVVNDETERNALLKDYPDAIAIEMEGEGVYTAAHDVQIEWVVVKGISDYADGTKTATKDWQPYASLMAASVVANILRNPMIFEDWPHCGGAPGGTSTVTALPTKRLRSSSGSLYDNKGAPTQPSAGPSKRPRTEPSSSSDSNQAYKVKEGPITDDDRETLAKELPCHWEALGRRLKISEAVLEGFQRNGLVYPVYSDKARAMLKKWQERDGEAATYQVLYDALCHKLVERRDLAEKICCWKCA